MRCVGAQLSWGRARQDAHRIAAGLHDLGLKPSPSVQPTETAVGIPAANTSPVILLHLPNSLTFAPLLFGVFAAGLTATMANPALTSSELKWILENAKPEVVVTSRESLPVMKEAITALEDHELRKALSNPKRLYVVDTEHEDYGLSTCPSSPSLPDSSDWKVLLSSNPLKTPIAFTAQECASRTAVILWSSGTSGKSKGVLLSHQSLTFSLAGLWHTNPSFDAHERWIGFAPFYHVFGLCNFLLLAPCCGATVFVMPKFNPQVMIACVQDYRVTYLHMAPPVAVLLAKSPMLEGFDFGSVKGGVSGGAPLARELIEIVYKRFGFIIKLVCDSFFSLRLCQHVDMYVGVRTFRNRICVQPNRRNVERPRIPTRKLWSTSLGRGVENHLHS